MKCKKCGNELSDGMTFCNKCGTPVNNDVSNKNSFSNNEKISINDVFDIDKTSNRIALIAKKWALQMKKRGETLGILVFILMFIIAISTYSFEYLIYGVITLLVCIFWFRTIGFIIRMGAEVIQLLDDIKNK